jgi:hypothetical protein
MEEKTIGVDVPPVTEQEAVAFMFHHLKLAAAYFEATPTEIRTPDHFSASAMRMWLEAMESLYPEEIAA